jgi:hypothetical protein
MAPYLAATYQSLLPAALKLGVATPEHSERLGSELAELARDSDYVLGPLVVGCWKTKREPPT